jgi:transposase
MIYSRLIPREMFLDLVDDIFSICPPERSSDYPISHYLRALLFILKTSCSYRDVIEIFPGVPDGHHSTIHKKFQAWAQAGVFLSIFDKLLQIYSREHLAHLDHLDIFVDSTHIRNKYGVDLISFGKKDHGKRGNTVSAVVDSNRFPVYFRVDPAHYNDATLIDPILDDLDQSEYLPDKLNVIGDKGYIKKLKKRVNKRNINLVTPRRKNEKRRNTKKELDKIKKRPVVENVFASLKQYKRISNRYEKKSENYFSYLVLAMILMEKKVLKKVQERKTVTKKS